MFLNNLLSRVDQMEEKTDAQIMGKRLILLRQHHELSQKDLAKLLECNQRYISEWESGKRLVSTRILLKLSKIFHITLAYFDPTEKGFESILAQYSKSSETAK